MKIYIALGTCVSLVQVKNSSIGNRLPSAKRDYFMPEIRKGKIDTLKLYLMIQTLEEEKFGKRTNPRSREKDA